MRLWRRELHLEVVDRNVATILGGALLLVWRGAGTPDKSRQEGELALGLWLVFSRDMFAVPAFRLQLDSIGKPRKPDRSRSRSR